MNSIHFLSTKQWIYSQVYAQVIHKHTYLIDLLDVLYIFVDFYVLLGIYHRNRNMYETYKHVYISCL